MANNNKKESNNLKKDNEEKKETEIEQESELEESEKLEESEETQDINTDSWTENISSFSSSSSAPVLEASSSEQTLEQQLEDVPRRRTEENREEEQVNYDQTIYNMPQYSYEKRVAPMTQEMRETGLLVRQEEVGNIKPTIQQRPWHELKHEQTWEEREMILKADRLEQDNKLPFEQKRYKGRRL